MPTDDFVSRKWIFWYLTQDALCPSDVNPFFLRSAPVEVVQIKFICYIVLFIRHLFGGNKNGHTNDI